MVPANPRKTTSLRPLGKVDVSGLRDAVLALPEAVWDFENSSKPNDYRALDRTRHVVFRFVDTTRDWRRSHDRPLWEGWRARIEPVLRQSVAPYGYANGVFPRVMLARMPPGGEMDFVDYADAGENALLSFERWAPNMPWEVSTGKSVLTGELTVYPAPPPSAP